MASISYSILASLCVIFTPVVPDDYCYEPWKLDRGTSEPVLIGFTNGTYPGKYTSLLWHWKAVNISGEWETTLWISHATEKILGSMAFRDSEGKISNSLMWRLDYNNLTWSSQGDKLLEANWTLSVHNIANWKFETDKTGNWSFKLGDIILERPEGEKILLNILENDCPLPNLKNLQSFFRKKREGESERHVQHSVSGQRAWSITREVLDRVFGNGENIRSQGWISHITNLFKIIGNAVTFVTGGSDSSNGDGGLPSITTPDTPTEAETFNPNDLP